MLFLYLIWKQPKLNIVMNTTCSTTICFVLRWANRVNFLSKLRLSESHVSSLAIDRAWAASHPSGCKDREYFLYCKILYMIICKIYYYVIASLSLIAVLKYTANPKYDWMKIGLSDIRTSDVLPIFSVKDGARERRI